MDWKTAAMTPEERMANRQCPECGDTVTRHSAKHHMAEHWPWALNPDDDKVKEALKRKSLLRAFAEAEDNKAALLKAQAAQGVN